jgi:hypothetical protein
VGRTCIQHFDSYPAYLIQLKLASTKVLKDAILDARIFASGRYVPRNAPAAPAGDTLFACPRGSLRQSRG